MTTVIVSGAVANRPFMAGSAWNRMTWVLGLRRLGFDVYFVEQIAPEHCVDGAGRATAFEASENAAYFDRVTAQFGLDGSACLVLSGSERTRGLSYRDVLEVAGSAKAVFNISGHLILPALRDRAMLWVYIDEDPGFTQFWHVAGQLPTPQGHDVYFTLGENVGTPGCSIPTGGIPWRPVRRMTVLEQWPVSDGQAGTRFTTVGSWRGAHGPVVDGDRALGLKVHQFRRFIDLPRLSPFTYEIALEIHSADRADLESLLRHGWTVADPRAVAGDPDSFRGYVQGSGAEFSVAKGMYVDTESGWFSDRTVRYLASGKPALVQDTGFGRNYPVGEGLVGFRTLEEAVSGAERIASDYEHHCRAARAIAEEYFDSDTVLGRMIEEIGLAP